MFKSLNMTSVDLSVFDYLAKCHYQPSADRGEGVSPAVIKYWHNMQYYCHFSFFFLHITYIYHCIW